MKKIILLLVIGSLLFYPAAAQANLIQPISPDLEIEHLTEEVYLFWNGEVQITGVQSEISYTNDGYILAVTPLASRAYGTDMDPELGNTFRHMLTQHPRGFEMPMALYMMIDPDEIIQPEAHTQVFLSSETEDMELKADNLKTEIQQFIQQEIDPDEITELNIPQLMFDRPDDGQSNDFMIQLFHLPETDVEGEKDVWLRSQDWEMDADQVFFPLASSEAHRIQGFVVMADRTPAWLDYDPGDFHRYVPMALTAPVRLAELDDQLENFFPTTIIYTQYFEIEKPEIGFELDLRIYGDPLHFIH